MKQHRPNLGMVFYRGHDNSSTISHQLHYHSSSLFGYLLKYLGILPLKCLTILPLGKDGDLAWLSIGKSGLQSMYPWLGGIAKLSDRFSIPTHLFDKLPKWYLYSLTWI